ncbi:MAG: hypothetical protein KAH06_05205, partial [Desulfobacterales bacterium]|nr:hypothetical protein [Desulfobacterales bacterium]
MKKFIESVNKSLFRALFGSITIASFLAILDIRNLAIDKGFSLTQPKWLILLIIITITGILATILFTLSWTKSFEKLKASYDVFLSHGEKLKWLFLVFFIASLSILPLLVRHPYIGGLLNGRLWVKIFVFLLITFISASFLRVARVTFRNQSKEFSWTESILFAALVQLLVYQLVSMSFYITDYPFALGWTRDSRHYYASLFFSERIYGQNLPLPILHPTLHFIFSLPFLFGKLPLWGHRTWSLLLTFGLTWAVVKVLSKQIHHKIYAIFFTLWAFLFL